MVKIFPAPTIPLFPNIQSFAELGRTTLGGANATISVSSLPNKRWLMVLVYLPIPTLSLQPLLRLNNDGGSNYADRLSANGAADTTDVSASSIKIAGTSALPQFFVIFIDNNPLRKERLIQAWSIDQNTAGAGAAPNRQETVGKWVNLKDVINEVDIVASTSTFATGSEVVVLGADPSDTNITPFFKELGRTTLAAASATMTITGITSKRYNFIMWNELGKSATAFNQMRFGNASIDSGSSYADRLQDNGAVDATDLTQTLNYVLHLTNTTPSFGICFGLNVAASEKLFMSHSIDQNTAGAATAPQRTESAHKWINTTSQFDQLQLLNSGAGTFPINSELIIWGNN